MGLLMAPACIVHANLKCAVLWDTTPAIGVVAPAAARAAKCGALNSGCAGGWLIAAGARTIARSEGETPI